MKSILSVCMIVIASTFAQAQQDQRGDTIVINLAKTSQVIFTMKDKGDIELLKQYDFQQLFDDLLVKMERNDTSKLSDEPAIVEEEKKNEEDWNSGSKENNEEEKWEDSHHRRTHQSFNMDLGINNYLTDGKFPEATNAPYTVRPWGSWYIAFNSIQRTQLAGKFFLEWGVGVSWYNFKFQNDKTKISKDDSGVQFSLDQRDLDFIKSKLTASYVNAFFIPVIDFGSKHHKSHFWEDKDRGFRFGVGPYIGYRLGSHSKVAYWDKGREKDHDRDNFYLQNLRYGARLQLGYGSADVFVNYDLNELFIADKGPKLNAFTFGVIF